MSGKIFEGIWALVRSIPPGQVATYGQVAAAYGNPRYSRVVVYALHGAPADVPCHRVVRQDGSLCERFEPFGVESHRLLLAMEEVPFRMNGTVALEKCAWQSTQPMTAGAEAHADGAADEAQPGNGKGAF